MLALFLYKVIWIITFVLAWHWSLYQFHFYGMSYNYQVSENKEILYTQVFFLINTATYPSV